MTPLEMESAITSFRRVLKQAWSQQVSLVVTTATPPPSLDILTVNYIANLRDPEWEEQERFYHETALSEVNSLVRKYNAMAPFIARRALYARNIELERLYKESAEEIHEKLLTKLSGKTDEPTFGSRRANEGEDFTNVHGISLPSLGIWAMFKELFTLVSHSILLGDSTEVCSAETSDWTLALVVDDLMRHRDGGVSCDWWGKIRIASGLVHPERIMMGKRIPDFWDGGQGDLEL